MKLFLDSLVTLPTRWSWKGNLSGYWINKSGDWGNISGYWGNLRRLKKSFRVLRKSIWRLGKSIRRLKRSFNALRKAIRRSRKSFRVLRESQKIEEIFQDIEEIYQEIRGNLSRHLKGAECDVPVPGICHFFGGIGKNWYRKKVSEPVSEKFGTGKKSRNRYRKNLVPEKVPVSVSFNILGTVTHCILAPVNCILCLFDRVPNSMFDCFCFWPFYSSAQLHSQLFDLIPFDGGTLMGKLWPRVRFLLTL